MDNNEEEICQELDISPTNFWQVVHRAKLLLRNCVEENWFKNYDYNVKELMNRLFLSCLRATELIEKQLHIKLSEKEKLQLKIL